MRLESLQVYIGDHLRYRSVYMAYERNHDAHIPHAVPHNPVSALPTRHSDE